MPVSSPDPKNGGATPSQGKSTANKTAAKSASPKPRPEFESHKVRREPVVQDVPWYNNWRMLVPIAAVILLAVILLGFAIGQATSRANAPVAPVAPAVQQPGAPAVGGAAPAGGAAPPGLQVTANAGSRSIPIEYVTSTPVPKSP